MLHAFPPSGDQAQVAAAGLGGGCLKAGDLSVGISDCMIPLMLAFLVEAPLGVEIAA